MASVDDRIVAMQFDNNAFQTKIADTIASLDRLKGSLDFANSKRGLDDLTLASKGFNLAGIGSAIEGVSSKFTAMGAVAFTVIQNITNRAIDAGIQLGKSLSLDQIIGGFQEYETNMNSIQTVLANTKSKGTELEDVNRALDQLNTYSDQTIYNFSQMARNIGTFTAAGIDLDTSVAGIKGIANLAAISGSNADQASTAMYQLSQALASGSVKLMDWNSVVNAGMGGEVFQKALFETGKALGTIKDVPLTQTFDEWKAAGNTFRSSLEDGWITADVLTNTLQGFTGDLTEAQIKALGYTDAQTKEILEMGQVGKEAATKVKTLTQLISTIKESIGSGWSASFRIIFGDFEEARTLFTSVSDAIGGMVKASSESRNAMLQNWKNLGGRQVLIDGITQAFKALSGILKPISAAFHDIFPPITVVTLVNLTQGFKSLMERLTPTPAVAALLTRTFRGVFSIFSIGIEVVKGIAHFFGDLFDRFDKSDDPNKGILGFTAKLGDGIYALRQALVDGEGIKTFFETLATKIGDFVEGLSFDNAVAKVVELLEGLKSAVFGIFDDADPETPNALSEAMGKLGERFGWLTSLGHGLASAWEAIAGKFDTIKEKLGEFGKMIGESFSGLPVAISNAISNTNYDQALDTVNTGLFAGLVVMFKKFLGGDAFNFGGVFKNVNKALGELTGVLSAMQTSIKADALLKIAGAVAVLVASMVILALIDSGALTKSMTAIAVGFATLVGVMEALDTLVSGPGAATKLALLSLGLIALAGALLILSVAIKLLSTMSWEELAKGMTAIVLLLTSLSIATHFLSENAGGMLRAGIGLIAVAIALNLLAGAVKLFSLMDWEEMGKGLAGIGAGILILAGGLNLMPNGMITKGIGLIAVAVALNILAGAVALFGNMEWETIGKGMGAIAAALLILAGAMALMPNGILLTLQGAGLALIGVGLVSISQAVQSLSSMSWPTLAKGIAGVAGVLAVLALAMLAMQGAIGGAVAITIASVGLIGLAKAVKAMASLSWGQLLKGIGGLALILGALALGALAMQPAIPALLGLGAALLLVGAGFALFGFGATAVATAFGILATAGTQGIATLSGALTVLAQHLPAIIAAIGDGIIQLAEKIVEALPGIIAGMGEVIVALLQVVIDSAPKLGETFVVLIHTALKAIRDTVPDFVATGFEVLLAFLKGIRDNIGEIVTVVVDIVTNFLDALALKVPEIIDSVYNLIIAIIEGVIDKLGDIASYLLPKGLELLQGLLDGIIEKALDVTNWFIELPGKILGWIGNTLSTLKDKGINLIKGLWDGITEKIADVIQWFSDLPEKVVEWIGDIGNSLLQIGKDIMNGLWNGMKSVWDKVTGWLSGLNPANWKGPPKRDAVMLVENGMLIMGGLLNGMKTGWGNVTRWLQSLDPSESVQNTIGNVQNIFQGMDNFNPVITPVLDLTQVENQMQGMNEMLQPTIQPTISYDQGQQISTAVNEAQNEAQQIDQQTQQGIPEIRFEQNNYSPQSLSTADIYRNTRNQIALAKEELQLV